MDYSTRTRQRLLAAALTALLAAPGCSDNNGGGDAAPDQALADAGADSQPTADRGPDSPASKPDLTRIDQAVADGPLMDGPVVKPDQAAPPDSKAPDTTVADSAPGVDGTLTFPGVLDGIWLLGHATGGNNYSWVKFAVSSISGGTAVLLDGKALTKNTPYWNCSGSTSWNTTSSGDTIQLNFPSGTCNGYRSANYTFVRFATAGTYPKGQTMQADVTTSVGTVKTLKAYKFPASQCNAAMSSCTDPL